MEYINTHNANPNLRLLKRLSTTKGSVFAYPSSTGYALGCNINDSEAIEKMLKMRGLPKNHYLTLLCHDMKQASAYVLIDNANYKLIKKTSNEVATFILPVNQKAPKNLYNKKRREMGIRLEKLNIVKSILDVFGGVFLSVSIVPSSEIDKAPINHDEVTDLYKHDLDFLVISDVDINPVLSTIYDCTGSSYNILR